ncbi:hypothetical protein BDN72DRAFT_604169 [Pluteus cervinus]|uniref:Uncharacterized protein n=1 Tax=Pluteus cervinus TaxID=181527 RepID=A0ACD3BB02_9AGAR|nr:hypothetical protein BDN72DRAFT_604169 [Pluteus cervinus]
MCLSPVGHKTPQSPLVETRGKTPFPNAQANSFPKNSGDSKESYSITFLPMAAVLYLYLVPCLRSREQLSASCVQTLCVCLENTRFPRELSTPIPWGGEALI